jgi:hypothetical protein
LRAQFCSRQNCLCTSKDKFDGIEFEQPQAARRARAREGPRKETRPRCGEPQLGFEIARKTRDTIQTLLLPGVRQNPLHPFGGVNTR